MQGQACASVLLSLFLKVLITIEHRAPHSHFAPGPTNVVVTPIQGSRRQGVGVGTVYSWESRDARG